MQIREKYDTDKWSFWTHPGAKFPVGAWVSVGFGVVWKNIYCNTRIVNKDNTKIL